MKNYLFLILIAIAVAFGWLRSSGGSDTTTTSTNAAPNPVAADRACSALFASGRISGFLCARPVICF